MPQRRTAHLTPAHMLRSCFVAVQNSERNPGVLLSKLVSFPTSYTFQVGAARLLPTAVQQLCSWLGSPWDTSPALRRGVATDSTLRPRPSAAAAADRLRVLRTVGVELLFLLIAKQQQADLLGVGW
jgi:hypothetical protein